MRSSNALPRFLYRGISHEMLRAADGRLVPKVTGAFERGSYWDEGLWDDGSTWDTSAANAVVHHQLHQAGNPTCGISTTPSCERAVFYATHGGTRSVGVVITIDRQRLAEHGVREFRVLEYATWPSVPEDDEFILVAADGGPLPDGVIVERLEVTAA